MSTNQPKNDGKSFNQKRVNLSAKVPSLKPEETLVPLQGLWAGHQDKSLFFKNLAEYSRSLVGGMAVAIYEQETEAASASLIAFASPYSPSKIKEVSPDIGKVNQSLKTLTSQRSVRVIDSRQCAELLAPFALQDGTKLCFTAILPPERVPYIQPCFVILHLVTQFLIQRELVVSADKNGGAFVQATMLVEMFSRTAEANDLPRALFSLSNELERFFQCRRVAIGTGTKNKCKVISLSGQSSDDRKGIGISQLNQVMRESIALDKILVWPSNSEVTNDVVVSANHDDLLHSYRAGSILVAPLKDHNDEPLGAMALLWSANTYPSNNDHQLVKACQPHLSSLLGFLKKCKPNRLQGAIRNFWSGSLLKRMAIFLLSAIAIGVLFLPFTYRLPADCRIQPVKRNIIAAPFDATLYRSHSKPGDIVRKDQVMAELDGRELRVELAEVLASQSSALKKRDSAMVSEEASNLQMAQLEVERLNYQVKRLNFRIDNLLVRSPIEGVVLAGNLKRSEGVPVSTGQMLFEIAPLDKMLIEIAIPESEIRYVDAGDEVHMRLESESSRVWETDIVQLHPVSVIEEGSNAFIAEAQLINENESLRPGMKGSVRIMTEKRALGWILFHRLWDYIKLKFW